MEKKNKLILGTVIGAVALPLVLRTVVVGKDISTGGILLGVIFGSLLGVQGAIILDKIQKNESGTKTSNADKENNSNYIGAKCVPDCASDKICVKGACVDKEIKKIPSYF